MAAQHVSTVLLLSQGQFSLGHDELIEFVNFLEVDFGSNNINYGLFLDPFGLVGLFKHNVDLLLLSLPSQDHIMSGLDDEDDGLSQQVSHLFFYGLHQDVFLVAKSIAEDEFFDLSFHLSALFEYLLLDSLHL